jgi:nitrite reductase/ring-hydroxylating ferredoxin subunit/uncharacterized membrane protein
MTRPTSSALDEFTSRVEHASVLDKPSDQIGAVLRRVLPPGPVRDVASGSPLGHPLHPVLIAIPIGSWTAASVLDLTGADAKAAKRLIGLGNLAALPAAVTGANDWLTTSGGERRVGLVHALLNDTALALYLASWLARHRGHRVRGAALALIGAGVVGAAGWLGGHLAFALGVGVDTTAFQHFPREWTDVAGESEVSVGRPVVCDAAGVPVLLVREHEGAGIVALADRCTHRGGPLHEGHVADGCVTCPWHGSQFALSDGAVVHGPATRPEPVAEVRIVDGRVQVRRSDEPRSMRTRPVGI